MEFSLVHWVENLSSREWDMSMSHIGEGPKEHLIMEVSWEDWGLVYPRLDVYFPKDEFEILKKAGLSIQWEENALWGDWRLNYPKFTMCLPKNEFKILGKAGLRAQ